jgi:hypothetical protein
MKIPIMKRSRALLEENGYLHKTSSSSRFVVSGNNCKEKKNYLGNRVQFATQPRSVITKRESKKVFEALQKLQIDGTFNNLH